jgi:sec-independent protein translocase protein TatC
MEQVPTETDNMPLLSHLDELLRRFRRSFIWILIGSSIGYYFSDFIYDGLKEPIAIYLGKENPLVFTRFFEKVGVLFRISIVFGLLIASPLLSYEVLAFVKPALKPREKKHIGTLLTSLVICFIAGSITGYVWILPFIINAVFSFGKADLIPMITVSSYVNASIGIIFMSALFFEIPAIMLNLSLWGWVKAETWVKGRRMSIVANSIASAILSPPDPWSMILMMIPLQVLFELGILLAKISEKFQKKEN